MVPWDEVSAIANVVVAVGVPLALLLTWYGIVSSARNERYKQFVIKFEEIVVHLPYRVFARNEIELSEEHKIWITAYIDLCAKELFDYLRGAVDADVWNDWEESIVANMRSSAVQEVFKPIKDGYPHLSALVEEGRVPFRRHWKADLSWSRL